MSTFEERQPALHPTRLAGKWSRRWGAAFGAAKDAVVDAAKLAVKSGFVALAPADALPRHAADVLLPQLAGESDDALRARILGAWDFWPTAGTLGGLSIALGLLGYTQVDIRTGRQFGRSLWAQWFAVAYGTGWTSRFWGEVKGWSTGTWGSTASRDTVRASRRFLRLVSNGRDIGWLVIGTAAPSVWGLGTWGTLSAWNGAVTRWRI